MLTSSVVSDLLDDPQQRQQLFEKLMEIIPTGVIEIEGSMICNLRINVQVWVWAEMCSGVFFCKHVLGEPLESQGRIKVYCIPGHPDGSAFL